MDGESFNQDEEEEEEILDLASHTPNDASETEEYDLRPVEKKKDSQAVTPISRGKVRRKVLPEERDSDDNDDEDIEMEGTNNPLESEDNYSDNNDKKVVKSPQKNDNKRKKKIKQVGSVQNT